MHWSQLKSILWLRWRLSRNQWRRGGSVNAVLAVIVVVVFCLLAFGGAVTGVVVGASILGTVPAKVILLVLDGVTCLFLFFWTLGVMTELQRSETIDLPRLLHLPVSLRGVFLVNYIASLLTPSIILFLPAMIGLCFGLMWSRGWAMAWLLPLELAFVFMLSAWTYCLRGWLASLMSNERRRRTVIVVIIGTFIAISQLPNIVIQLALRHDSKGGTSTSATPHRPEDRLAQLRPMILAAHYYVPPLWVGHGAWRLAQGSSGPAALGSLGAFVLGGLGLRRAYRSTLRFYRGEAKAPARSGRVDKKLGSTDASKVILVERRVPGIPDDSAALALASFRAISRGAEMRMLLMGNLMVPMVLGLVMLTRRSGAISPKVVPFFATGVVAFTFFGLIQAMFNQFGFDRDGFRALILLPTPRQRILLGRNLGILPFAAGISLALLAVWTLIFHPSPLVLIAAVLQFGSAFLLMSMVANYMSVMFPYRVASGSMRASKPPFLTILMIVVAQLLLPLAMLPIALPPALGLFAETMGWLSAPPINLALSLALLLGIGSVYVLTLGRFGDLLQSRERRVLEIVTREVE